VQLTSKEGYMAGESILIVEDDRDISELIAFNLSREGFKISKAFDGFTALKMATAEIYDLVLLDLMLPDIDGLEICRNLKEDTIARTIPIIMVTAKGEEADIVAGIELGADDYIIKPFSPKVLMARVRAAIRRKKAPKTDGSEPVTLDDLSIHPGRREVLIKGQPVDLTFAEFEILHYLTARPGWVFTRYQIVNAVRGEGYHVTDRSVDVQIVGIRKKLGPYGTYIETIRGVGYRFSDKRMIDRD
jgi:two-component system, OmpR family, alkaline phosphatase synthesis response regulator PhoP